MTTITSQREHHVHDQQRLIKARLEVSTPTLGELVVAEVELHQLVQVLDRALPSANFVKPASYPQGRKSRRSGFLGESNKSCFWPVRGFTKFGARSGNFDKVKAAADIGFALAG